MADQRQPYRRAVLTVQDAYDDGLYAECEVCGADLHRVQLDAQQRGTGLWMEHREHAVSGGTHQWRQAHNCVRPQPDSCYFCPPASGPSGEVRDA